MDKSKYSIVSPLTVYARKKNTVWYAGAKTNKIFLLTRHIGFNKKVKTLGLPVAYEVDYGGACLFVRSEVFRSVGYYDERYDFYGGDVEWAIRAREAEYPVCVLNRPLLAHEVSATAGTRGTTVQERRLLSG